MPIYEYICLKCNHKFALLQGLNSEKNTVCPGCSSKEVKKVVSSFSCSSGPGGGASSAMPVSGFGGGG
ncbi:MAG: zinc ribbon domain-containing protein [Nitrospiraceae bacterium]|nr:MAG: zinc ribbon domain-containing protein [Nitrospiraceae bacterium]